MSDTMLIDSLYETHEKELFRFARSLARKEEEAEDLVQETFLKALVHLYTLANLPSYQQRAWLFKVLRNLYFDRYRKRRFEQPLGPDEEPNHADRDDFLWVDMKDLLETLPHSLREVVYQRYYLGMSSKQIAEPLGLADATVRDRLRKALQLLKMQLHD